MAIAPLNERLNSILPDGKPDNIEATPSDLPLQTATAPQDVAAQTEDGVQVAGLLSPKMLGEVLGGLTKKGTKTAKDIKVTPDVPAAKAGEVKTEVIKSPDLNVITDPPVKIEAPAPVSAERMQEQINLRGQLIEDGAAAKAPDTPISNLVFDSTEMQATVRSAAEMAVKEEPTMSVRSMYMRAINAGVPETTAKRILEGLPMESTVGGSQLAQNMAGILKLHDDSAKQLDTLFTKMRDGTLDQAGQLELRQQMAFHDLVVKQLKGVQVDVARAMNTFKRVRDAGPGFAPTDVRKILDDLGGDATLQRLADDYLNTPTQAGKNKVLEAGLGAKLTDAWMYVYQSNLLTNPDSHAYNLVGNSILGALAPVERMLASGLGKTRQALNIGGSERFYMSDIQARLSGFYNGMLDGWEMAAHAWKTGERATAKGDAPVSPLSAEAFSDTPISMFGKELYRTPDLTNTWLGKTLDALGYFHSIPFRALGAADELIGGVSARMQLHEEAWIFAQKEFDKLTDAGMSEADAMAEVKRMVANFTNERPASIQANVDSFRKQVTLQSDLDRETALGEFYWKLDDVLQIPAIKVFVPFSKTITNLFIEGAARTPGLNLVSPRFWDEWSQGGKHRDLAMARLSLGGSAISTTAYLGMQNRVTGSGPSEPEDKQALIASGWQPYSLIFGPGELDGGSVDKLSQLTKVTPGKGSMEGYYFVSYARFDPISPVLAMGADFADAMKFHKGRPDEPLIMDLALAAAGSSSEYISNLPVAGFIGDLVAIARSRQEDGGRKVVDMFDRVARQYSDFLYTGTPGLGFTNSSLVAKIERLVDPTIRSTLPSEMDVPPGLRAFYETRSKIMSRIPGLSAGVPPELDNMGRERVVQNRGLDNYWNFNPVLSVTGGKRSEADEALISLDHGISRPRDTWDGVKLSAVQFNRYKQLYGQAIQLALTNDGVPRNLEQTIPIALREAEDEAMMSGQSFAKGEKQAYIDQLVSKYRRIAKIRMVGFDPSPEPNQIEAPDLTEAGLFDSTIEFPELGAAISKNKEFKRVNGK